MKALIIPKQQKLTLILLSVLTIFFNSAIAKSDMEIMADVQKERAKIRGKKEFTAIDTEEGQRFRGVYFGYLPCKHCAGIKTTLSLKNRKNYLIVTQYAQASNKEFYEKGKYNWDDKANTVTLTSRKDGSIQKFLIEDEWTLIKLTSEGMRMKGSQSDYTLLRNDKKKTRMLHIH